MELKKYEEKAAQLRKDGAEFKAGGSRYGDEYGEIQIKVYNQMINEIKEEIKRKTWQDGCRLKYGVDIDCWDDWTGNDVSQTFIGGVASGFYF